MRWIDLKNQTIDVAVNCGNIDESKVGENFVVVEALNKEKWIFLFFIQKYLLTLSFYCFCLRPSL